MSQRTDLVVNPAASGKKLLNELLETSRSLPTNSSELGSIQLGINQIRKKANKLRGSETDKTSNNDNKQLTNAHYLLAGTVSIEDVEIQIKLLEKSQILESRHQQQQLTNSSNVSSNNYNDLDSYLKSKKDENILSTIEQFLSSAALDFDNFVNQNISLDWKQRRDEIRESFGIILNKQTAHTDSRMKTSFSINKDTSKDADNSKNNNEISWGKSSKLLDNTKSTSNLNVNSNHYIRNKFERYAKIINQLNNYRQSLLINGKDLIIDDDLNSEFDLSNEFLQVFKNNSDNKSKQFNESWKIISNLKVNYNKTYTLENFKNKIISNSKTYLEKQFFEYIDNIFKNKTSEKGLPTIVNKVKSFISYQKLNSNGNLLIVNGIPIWAVIFYLLRAGCEQDALNLVLEHQLIFKKVEQSFVSYFKSYVQSKDKRLSQTLVTKIQNEFNHHIKNSIDGDPYRFAVYKILGRCQLSRRNISNIALTVEDWLWMHLMLVREDAQVEYDPVYERYTLKELQTNILSLGEKKFPTNYLQVLLLTGLYEEAFEYSSGINEIDSIHLYIGLSYYKILQNSSSDKEDLIKRGKNFSLILSSYIKSFKNSDPRIAVEYLILICLFKDQIETCHEALRELILETREFSILLGKINSNGIRIPGKIEQRKQLIHLEDDFLNKITQQAAIIADKEGRIYDGLLLYQLSEETEIVATIVNRLLGEFLSNTELDQSLLFDGNNETNPILIAENLINLNLDKISIKQREICLKLLKISEIRQLFIEKDWELCIKKINELEILPINSQNDLGLIRLKAEELTYLDENLLRNIPNLLIITMTCIAQINEVLVNSSIKAAFKDEKLKELKLIAKNCIVFAGMVQYKMPRETFSMLIDLEALL